jgi:OmcA/MtrC family decaheme c-type cytochrome
MSFDAATQTFHNDTVPAFGKAAFNTNGLDGEYLVTGMATAKAPEASDAFVYIYIAQGPVGPAMGHVQLYNDVVNVGLGFGALATPGYYTNPATVASCENCHGAPYRKHGYRMAKVPGLDDFVACKACHYDNLVGSDHEFQFMGDDPVGYALTTMTTAMRAKYAYTANVMADTHMSHAFEFDYPQSMSNCSTCHTTAAQLAAVTANFQVAICKSCHPVTGPTQLDASGKNKYQQAGRAPALTTLMTNPLLTYKHANEVAKLYSDASGYPATCTGCHDGSTAPSFAEIHTGYDASIYSPSQAAGTRYSDVLTASVDSAVLNAGTLTVTFSATQTLADPVTVESITPTLMVGLYGYDTKDFIVDSHGRDAQNNRNLEWVYGASHPRFKNFSRVVTGSGAGEKVTWQVDVNLSAWAPSFATSVFRAEIGVLPTVKDTTGTVTFAVNAPSRTFDLVKNVFVDGYYPAIVDANKCNACHDALATTFHSGDRGGNVVICRFCHNTRSGAGYYEMQSRSIDSFVHAAHSFQGASIASIDFADPVSSVRYAQRMEAVFPTFTLTDCEACHVAGMYGVPDNSKSLSGVISAAAKLKNASRNIGTVPATVVGPAQRACGGCHRAWAINQDVPGGTITWANGGPVSGEVPDGADRLMAFDQHAGTMGYMLTSATGVLDAAIQAIQSLFTP